MGDLVTGLVLLVLAVGGAVAAFFAGRKLERVSAKERAVKGALERSARRAEEARTLEAANAGNAERIKSAKEEFARMHSDIVIPQPRVLTGESLRDMLPVWRERQAELEREIVVDLDTQAAEAEADAFEDITDHNVIIEPVPDDEVNS